ncbi:MAG: hypothetical protein ATN36_02495 [Epulopiscium sp. Nele67-Bin005]|nr:MAG: hypothetical protein ATN36_02495 [Epulopiscium sp. Nele67-Bin005]
MKVEIIVAGSYEVNCYLISDSTKDAVIVDPGAEGPSIIAHIKEKGLNLKAILITHGHFDHIGAAEELRDAFGAEIIAHEKGKQYLEDISYNLSFRVGREHISFSADRYVSDGEIIKINDKELQFKVIYVPGHSADGVAYYQEKEKAVFVGDILFAGAIGRSDLPGGNSRQLLEGIKQKLFTLSNQVKVYTGHGDITTIGHEKQTNPYFAG